MVTNTFVNDLFKYKTVSLTMEQALAEQARLVSDCKILGDKVSKDLDKKTWKDLERHQKALQILTVHIQRYNSEGNNIDRIKERELLIRQLEVLEKAEKTILIRKAMLTLDRFTSWLTGKARINIEKLRAEINEKVGILTTALADFNKQEVVVQFA